MSATRIIKQVTKNPRMLFAYLNATGLLNSVSDEKIIKLLWWVRFGKKLNVDSPKTFNEKIQWLKMYNHDPKLTMLVDKYAVREYIKGILGEEHLIPLYGVWSDPEQIDFEELPDQFVLKCNHNAGVGLCICRDKKKLDFQHVKHELQKGLNNNFYYSSREWAYKNVPRKIICEKYMEDDSKKGLRDYKFFCFNGKAKFVYLSEGLENHKTANISFYDLKGNEMPFRRKDYEPFSKKPVFPPNFNDLIAAANLLAENLNLPFVRIDLYSIANQVYFSEITCYPNSGYIPFDPEMWDAEIGKWIDLSSLKLSYK